MEMGRKKQKRKSHPAGQGGAKGRSSSQSRSLSALASGCQYPLTVRLHAVRLVAEEGLTADRVQKLLGPAGHTIRDWVRRYAAGGVDALVPYVARPPVGGRKPRTDPKREAVVTHKREEPSHGTRRIRDVLRALRGARGERDRRCDASCTSRGCSSRRRTRPQPARAPGATLRASGPEPALAIGHLHVPARGATSGCYLAVFMDDHSRFIVSQARRTTNGRSWCWRRSSAALPPYGTPEEMLTDNGTAVRDLAGRDRVSTELAAATASGTSSRPQHPADARQGRALLEDAVGRVSEPDRLLRLRRLRATARLFIDGYNFQRPHQGLDGLVPADRFFRASRSGAGRRSRKTSPTTRCGWPCSSRLASPSTW